MTARAKDLLQSDNPIRPPTGEPDRSRVAPVGHDTSESNDDFSDTIKKLLAGIEPKIASEAIARAETLGKLPPAQQTLLRCALSAASETFRKAEILQNELAGFKERQRRAETDLLAESQALSRRSVLTEAQVASLREDLAASVAANYARESRFLKQRRYLWLALGATVSAGIVCALLLSRSALPAASAGLNEIHPDSSSFGLIPHRSMKEALQPNLAMPDMLRVPAKPRAGSDTVLEQTLDRLDKALARVPSIDTDIVLHEANQWLMASRSAPCFVRFGEGEISLLVRVKGKDAAPLKASLARCTEAVEHITE